IHASTDHLIKTDLNGVQAWSVARNVRQFEASQGATTRTIALLDGQSNKVYHAQDGGTAAATALDGTPWNLAISPDGVYSAVTAHKSDSVAPRIYLFKDMALRAALEMPLKYANSLTVSDDGEVFVGGQTATGAARMLIYHHDGNLLWQADRSAERHGHRPELRVTPNGDRFVALSTAGLTAYAIDRSPTP
ncbi:MAG: hypothetical protein ABW004_14815, partial [Aeromicrobium sp.]